MNYLIILGICLLSTMKVSFQSVFAKKGVKTISDSVFFIGMIFLFSSLAFIPKITEANLTIWIYAALFGAFSVAFQLIYTLALSEGNVSLAVMFANFGMLVPIAISCFVYGEKPSALRITGIALTALAFIVTVKPGGKTTKKAFLLCVGAMLTNGAGSGVQKFFSATEHSSKNFTYVAAAYLIAAGLAAACYAVLLFKGKPKTFRLTRRPVLSALAAGVSLGVYLALNTYATATIEGTFLFPAHAGGSIIFSTVAGLLFFKDKLTLRQVIALCLGTVSIVLMNF